MYDNDNDHNKRSHNDRVSNDNYDDKTNHDMMYELFNDNNNDGK